MKWAEVWRTQRMRYKGYCDTGTRLWLWAWDDGTRGEVWECTEGMTRAICELLVLVGKVGGM